MNLLKKLCVLLFAFAASALVVSQANAAELKLNWQDATLEAVPVVLSSIKSDNEAVGLAALGVLIALTGQDVYVVKIEVQNTTWRSLTLYPADFKVSNDEGVSRPLCTFLYDGGGKASYSSSLGLAPGASRVVYGIFAAPYGLGKAVRRGDAYLGHPRM